MYQIGSSKLNYVRTIHTKHDITITKTSQGYQLHKTKGISHLSNQLLKLVQTTLSTVSDS
jgi:hypothetical protein